MKNSDEILKDMFKIDVEKTAKKGSEENIQKILSILQDMQKRAKEDVDEMNKQEINIGKRNVEDPDEEGPDAKEPNKKKSTKKEPSTKAVEDTDKEETDIKDIKGVEENVEEGPKDLDIKEEILEDPSIIPCNSLDVLSNENMEDTLEGPSDILKKVDPLLDLDNSFSRGFNTSINMSIKDGNVEGQVSSKKSVKSPEGEVETSSVSPLEDIMSILQNL